MTDYEPGTVAVATVRGVPNVRVMAGKGTAEPKLRWFTTDNRVYAAGDPADEGWYFDFQVTDVRPLAVLDLGQNGPSFLAANLKEAARRHRDEGFNATADDLMALADQVEAQTRPPKPAEPTGLGATVTDRDGEMWVRNKQGAWINLHGRYGLDPARTWADLCDKYGPIEVTS